MIYNKLVRDKIPEIIVSKGERPITHMATAQEYEKKLVEKLQEEVSEFLEGRDVEELVDILEVIRALCNLKGISWDTLEAMRIKKREARGGFEGKIILERKEI